MNPFSSVALLPSIWLRKNTVPKLDQGTHIWAIELRQSPNYQATFFEWLSSAEKSKAQRMLVNLKRDHQIQSKAWLRWLLAQYTQSSPEQIQYHYGSLGKPYLGSEQTQIFFNATDSGSTLLCAFSKKNELGLDIESTPRKVNYQRIAEKKFTQLELAAINSTPQATRSNAFLALWTRKEAFGKALGVGIRYQMNKINLCNQLDLYQHQLADEDKRNWNLFQFNHRNNIACIATTQMNENINFYELDIDSLSL